jgi:CubicO group peptidase (beta-lactamase class C family)/murein DD-endopeptidase MepM/ murein hydrolase activator NlpD
MILLAAIILGSVALGAAGGRKAAEPSVPATIVPLVRTVDLNLGEMQDVELADGSKARVKLLDLQETRDRLRNAVREAQVTVEVNGASLTLVSALYHLPVTAAGVQIDCPITKGYLANDSHQNPWSLQKDARLRLWPAGSPWIQPGTFVSPVRQRWLASDTQMANEPCYVNGAELPSQKDIYYHYGLDFGGAEGLVEVVAATDGLVVSAAGQTLPEHKDSPAQPRYDVIYIVDGRGWYYRYSHLMTIEVKPGQRVRMGERIGLLGKEGGSGGWSHLHFDITSRQPSGAWGIQDAYAYAWQAYQHQYHPRILAVARPHRLVTVGEKVTLDGTKSWSAAGKIARYEWTFTDGGTASGPAVERTYTQPGTYSEILQVTDDTGQGAWDFTVVEVQDPSRPNQLPPVIHPVYFPTTGLRPGDPVTFKVRSFRTTDNEERWDFGDGSPPVTVRSDGNVNQHSKDGYAVTEHRYARPGNYLVRVERSNNRGEKAVGRLIVPVGAKDPSPQQAFDSDQAVVPAAARPIFPGRQWTEATPESQGVDSAKLKAAVAYMDGEFGSDGAQELVIVRNGRLIHKGPDSDAYHNAWSCTKTFTSTVLGVLAAEGKCSLDDLAVKYLPELDDEYPAYAGIRLRHLASMSSGYKGQVVNVSAEQPWGEPIAYLKPTAPLFEPGTRVQYHDHQVFVLGRILNRLAGQSEASVFRQRIAEPIGMTRWDWSVSGPVDGLDLNNAAGTPNTPGIQTTAVQMARFGLLYLSRGRWDGQQLLPAAFVDEATRNQVAGVGASAFLHGRYGFYWWTNDIKPDGRRPWPSAPPRTYTSHGHSANFCFVIPEWNMVVVRMGTHSIAAGVRGIYEIEAKWDTFFARLAEALTRPTAAVEAKDRVNAELRTRNRGIPRTRVSIRDGRWFLNDEVTYRGTQAEGLLMNVRMVNAVFEDANRPAFDPEANTAEFLAQIPDYVAQGVRAFTLCLQGGMPGYEGAVNSAFQPDGSLRDSYLRRVRRVIEACDRHGAAVILGCFYQRQDQILKDEAAVRAGVVNVARWIEESGFTNVVLEIANEFDHNGFDHRVLKTPAGMAELIGLAKQTVPHLRVSASGLGHGRLPDEVARASDFLLIHFNGTRVEDIPARIAALKKFAKPIVCNEDEKIGRAGARACELSVANGASWGFMHVEVNQHHPFTFRGAADDPEVYAAMRQLTSENSKSLAPGGSVKAEGLGDGSATGSDTIAKRRLTMPPRTEDTRLRLLIETDAGGDPDDEQSLVRFLLYANEWDVEGIIANRPATRRPENKNPEDTGLAIVRRLLDAYGQCRPNLVRHDARYPTREFLWQRTVAGYDDTNDAVNLILAAVDKDDPRPLWYSDWGTDHGAATNNLKRALDRVLRERGLEGYARFKSKLRLTSYDKFGEHTTTLVPPFALWVDTFRPPVEGKRWYHRFSALTAKAGGFDLKRDVLADHGPLGALYPTNTGLWGKEGDTMTFLYLVPTGMNDPQEPTWGSWAGRYGLNEEFPGKPYYWASQTDAWKGVTNRDNTLARWAADLQNDFRARLDWCVKPPREANHAPLAVVNGRTGKDILKIDARPGQEVSLDAGASRDPDGDRLAYEWFVYREAGTYRGEASLTSASASQALLHIPGDAAGTTLHVILTVRDNDTPPLAAYRRIVVQVQPDAAAYFPPPESQGGWRKLDDAQEIRAVAGMDPVKLDELKEWLLHSDKRNFAAVVIRRGHIVLEVERGNSAKTDSRRVASVSKAVCATVLAIASEQSRQGLTPRKMTFDDPAFEFIPWAQPLSDPRKAQITVKQLLNHTSGLCPEAIGAPNDGTWEYVLGLTGDPRTARLAFDPGTACGYSSHALHHAALVCETVTGEPYDQFAIEALFQPLGIEHWWFQYFDGGDKIGRHPTHGLGMPARDLARIAYCMRHDGRWNDRQIIPKWFVDQTGAATHPVTSPEMRWKLNPQTFSHGWELPAVRNMPASNTRGDIPADARYKPGSGGQLMAFVPSLDLVITRQTGASGDWAYEEYLRRACAAVIRD